MLGSTGNLTDDIMYNTRCSSPLTALELSIKWRHMIPSAPSTIYCNPFYDREPFIIDNIPDIYFTANQDKFESKILNYQKNILLLSIPKFSTSNQIVLVDLCNYDINVKKVRTELNKFHFL